MTMRLFDSLASEPITAQLKVQLSMLPFPLISITVSVVSGENKEKREWDIERDEEEGRRR